MPTRSHKVRSFLITALAAIVLLVAVVFSVFRFAVPYVTDYGDSIETELSSLLGMTVEIGFVDADMYWLTPRLNLLDVNIYDASGERHFLHFNEIHLSLAWLKTISTLRPALGVVSLSGLDVHVERRMDGSIMVQGFEIASGEQGEAQLPEGVEQFLENFSFYLFDSSLHWLDEIHNDQRLELLNINLAMINQGERHELSVAMDLPAMYGEHVELKANIEGPLLQPQQWQASLYLALQKLRLRKWFDDYWQLFDFAASGMLDASMWLDMDHGKLRQIHASLNGRDLALHYLDDEVRSWKLQHLVGSGNWKQTANGWKSDVRGLEITRDNRPWARPGTISLEMDALRNEIRSRAGYLRIDDLTYVAGLVTSLMHGSDAAWQTRLMTFNPRGDLLDLDLRLPLNNPGNLRIQTGFNDLAFESGDKLPSIEGLDGQLRYQDSEAVIELDSRNVKLDFHDLFRNPIELQSIFGTAVVYRDNTAWHVFANPVDINSPYISSLSRLELILADDRPPFMNLITLFHKGDGAHKSLYFPTAIMDEDTVAWLDRAIVRADIPRGGLLYHGSFIEYPFNQGEGVMEVLFDIENSRLQYMPNWPALENLKAEVRFHNASMSISGGQGTIYGARFYDTQVSIPQLGHAHLSINGRVDSPLADLLKFADNSPLQQTLGSYVTGLQTQGPAGLDLDIQIPLATHDPAQVKGALSFRGNEVYLPQEKYRFQNLNGTLAFTERSVSGENLIAELDGAPLKLHIETEENADDRRLRINAQGNAPVKALLSPVPNLLDYVEGRAGVDVDIRVPLADESRLKPLSIQLQANIENMQSTLPGSLQKESGEAAALGLAMDIFDNGDLDIRLDYAGRLSADAKREAQRWQLAVDSAELKGKGFFHADFSQDETLRLDIDYVNASALVGEHAETARQKIMPQQIPSLDVNIHKLDWKKWHLRDVSLQTTRSNKGMHIQHLEAHPPSMTLTGSGSWITGWRNTSTTTLAFLIQTQDLGDALKQMDLTQAIRKTEGTAEFNWQWNAEPYRFDWDRVKGEGVIDLKDGGLSDIEPGAGRLLGIFSFETLLSLDFGSQVSKGFAFDSMQGKLVFNAGNAYTEDFLIKGKVAEISMQGRIGLRDEDYDQIITVTPGVGSTLTLIGAVTGGPVTAAAVHFIQKIFGVNRMAAYKYSVKGPWADPQVQLLVKPDEE